MIYYISRETRAGHLVDRFAEYKNGSYWFATSRFRVFDDVSATVVQRDMLAMDHPGHCYVVREVSSYLTLDPVSRWLDPESDAIARREYFTAQQELHTLRLTDEMLSQLARHFFVVAVDLGYYSGSAQHREADCRIEDAPVETVSTDAGFLF